MGWILGGGGGMMGTLRDEIEKLVTYPHRIFNYEYETINKADVLSILDEWELVKEDTVREGEFLKERGELLRDVVNRMLTPVPTQHEIVSPGDHIAIYRRGEDE